MRSIRTLGPLAALALVGCGGGGGGSKSTVTVPVIKTQPVAQTVEVGASASFSVVATGPSLTYQWTKDGAAIDGATSSSFTIGTATLTDAGAYAVVVTNTVDSVPYSATSNDAVLTVSNTGSGTVTVD